MSDREVVVWHDNPGGEPIRVFAEIPAILRDGPLYGNLYLSRDEDGVYHQIDPTTVEVRWRSNA